MEQVTVDPRQPDREALERAAAVLRRGGVVAYPTETVYGLAVDARDGDAAARLFAMKAREPSVAIALIAADAGQAEQAGRFGARERQLIEAFWPGPLTIVVPASAGVSARLCSAAGTIGVRVPSHLVARELARVFGGCITATSANRSSRPPAVTAAEVAAALGDSIDLLIDGGPSPGGPPSTVIGIVNDVPVLYRAGAVAWDRVLESLE
jgi:L-threonylcarbamoyladenylate synthase